MRDLVVYGLGELGQLYGAAALRAGIRVTPITRAEDPKRVLRDFAPEVPILVAVGECDLEHVLCELGPARGQATILLQNELFPSAWRRHEIQPTVLVPWLLKKRGTPLLVARPTPVFGLQAELVVTLHRALDLPVVSLRDEPALHQALVDKYAFILTINALGLLRDRTLGMWLQEDPLRVDALANEAAQLGAVLCQQAADSSRASKGVEAPAQARGPALGSRDEQRETLLASSAPGRADVDLAISVGAVVEAMRALSVVGARGRTASARVARAREHGERLGLELPELARVAEQAKRA